MNTNCLHRRILSLQTLGCFVAAGLFSPLLIAGQHSGTGSYFYLRCNASSWQPDAASLLYPAASEGVLTREIAVKDSWMSAEGDTCIITETPALYAWGDWQHHFGASQGWLQTPSSANLVPAASGDGSQGFRIRFAHPGLYTFQLDTRDNSFAVFEARANPQGAIAWAKPKAVFQDSLGRYFSQTYGAEASLSRVASDSGRSVWTFYAQKNLSFLPNCSFANALIVYSDQAVRALHPATGKPLWAAAPTAIADEEYPFLSCFRSSPWAFVSYGGQEPHIIAYDRQQGQRRWEWTGDGYTSMLGSNGEYLFLSRFAEGRSSILALKGTDGSLAWSLDELKGMASLTDDGHLLVQDGPLVTLLDPKQGSDMWHYAGKSSLYSFYDVETKTLFLQDETTLFAMSPAQGTILWRLPLAKDAQSSSWLTLLRGPYLLIRSTDYERNRQTWTALRKADGKQLWQRSLQETASYPYQSADGELWVQTPSSLAPLEAQSGQSLWTFNWSDAASGNSLLSIVEADQHAIYLAYGRSGGKFPPMGLLALSRSNGRELWRNWFGTAFYRVGSDAQQIMLSSGYLSSTLSIAK